MRDPRDVELLWLRCSTIWNNILVRVLGWPQDKALDFIQQLRRELDSTPFPKSDFFYDAPCTYLTIPILGNEFYAKLEKEGGLHPVTAHRILSQAIAGGTRELDMLNPDFDWSSARDRYQKCRQQLGLNDYDSIEGQD